VASPETSQDRLRPLACQGKKNLVSQTSVVEQKKVGRHTADPRKECFKVSFTFLALFMGLKAGSKREPAASNRRASYQTNEY
jgi:hypothetical protein